LDQSSWFSWDPENNKPKIHTAQSWQRMNTDTARVPREFSLFLSVNLIISVCKPPSRIYFSQLQIKIDIFYNVIKNFNCIDFTCQYQYNMVQ
jgi:hypothetical protein